VGIVLISLATGYGLEKNTSAALPYLDSFTTWGAVITTYMVAQKVLENWLYWLVIDTVAIYLYIDRELYLTALLMAVYVVLAMLGWLMWLKEYREQTETVSVQAVV
jgi:nicotinamide mononucleotide transporter